MAWRLAKSLIVLRDTVNALSPMRSKVSDGTIGNAEHSARASDHNPNEAGVVCAMDITNDPDHGINSETLANALLASKDRRIKYVISNKKIASGAGGPSPWQWRPYTGKNPHNHHCHISVRSDLADVTEPWTFDMKVTKAQAAKPVTQPKNPVLAQGTKGPDVARLQQLLKMDPDADFGPKTKTAVMAFQKSKGLVVDGVVGPGTWEALGA